MAEPLVRRIRTRALLAPLALLVGCAPPPPPPPPAPEPLPVVEPEPFPHTTVWTAGADTPLRYEDREIGLLPHPFTRLEVLHNDSTGLLVRCLACEYQLEGYVSLDQILAEPLPPEVAAWGELAEFALAVRDAASRRDLDALRRIMAADFTFSFMGIQNPDEAFAVWRSEQFATLSQAPELLDGGLATRDGQIWSAPPAFARQLDYRGLRLGFLRRPDGRWEWIYLIRGIVNG